MKIGLRNLMARVAVTLDERARADGSGLGIALAAAATRPLANREAVADAVKYGTVPMSRLEYWTNMNQDADGVGVDYSQPFARHPHVYRAITVISESIASCPLILAKKQPGTKRPTPVESGPEWQAINEPSWDVDASELIAQTAGFMQCSLGESFWALTVVGKARSIVVIPPELVTIRQQSDGSRQYEVLGYGQPKILQEHEIIHFRRAFNPYNPLRGIGPLAAARMTYEDDFDIRAHNRAIVKNGGVQRGLVTTDQSMPSTEEMERAKAQLEILRGPMKDRGKVAILGNNLKWQDVGMTTQDMDWATRALQTPAEIGQCFGVPPSKMGDYKRDAADAEIQERDFWNDTMKPIGKNIAATIQQNMWKLSGRRMPALGERWAVMFDFSQVPALMRQEVEFRRLELEEIEAGRRLINEVRERAGEEPLPWGNVWMAGGIRLPITGPDGSALPAFQEPEPEPDDDGEEPATPKKKGAKSIERELTWIAYAANMQPFETQLVREIRQEYTRVEAEVVGKIRSSVHEVARAFRDEAQRAGNGNGYHTKDSINRLPMVAIREIARPINDLLFDPAELARKIANRSTPVMRGAQKYGGNRGLKLARKPAQTFRLDAAPAIEQLNNLVQGFATPIANTTWQELKAGLAEGLSDGLSEKELVDIAERILDVRRARAANAARTEINGCFNGGTALAFAQSGAVRTQIWLPAGDEHVRDDHEKAGGQEVEVGKQFVVGGEFLSYPGDPKASAKQRCECRCALMPGEVN